jgi:hypothetical protein
MCGEWFRNVKSKSRMPARCCLNIDGDITASMSAWREKVRMNNDVIGAALN